MRFSYRSWLVLVLLAAGTILVPLAVAHAWAPPTKGAEAHPGPNQQVPTSPDVLFIRFTENVEREYTRAEVYDLNGTRVDLRQVLFDDAKRDQIIVPLGNLTDGIYTVRWYSLSVDTHTAQGSWVFAVGSASLAGAPPPTSSHYHGEGTLPIWLESAARAFHYAAAAAAVGMPLFVLIVARTASQPNLRRLVATIAALAGLGFLGALTILYAFSQRIATTVGSVASSSFGTVGSYLTIRAALQLVLLLAAIAAFVLVRTQRKTLALAVIPVVGAAILFATSLSSHAAALSEDRWMAIGADVLHLGAGSVWIGGVAAFLLTFWQESRDTVADWIKRFSPIAIACVMFILLTGTYASLLHLQRPADLVESTYGLMILIKILLVIPLIALGAFNRYVARSRLVEGTQWRSSNLQRALVLETSLMALVLVAAGVLATSPPPGTSTDLPDAPTTVKFERSLEDAHMVLSIGPAPLTVGLHNFTVELHAFDGSNPPGTQVQLQFAAPGRAKSDELHAMTRESADRWTLSGGFLTERGTWTVHVLVQTDDYSDNAFEVPVQ